MTEPSRLSGEVAASGYLRHVTAVVFQPNVEGQAPLPTPEEQQRIIDGVMRAADA